MVRFISRVACALVLLTHVQVTDLRAQDAETVWVQIEAQPSLALAEDAIRGYADRLQDVNGFSLGGGWYGIALGPYSREDAGRVLQVLRSEGAIPRDSYIAQPSAFRQQFWPRGGDALNTPAVTGPQGQQVAEEAQTEELAEARRSESLLTREERMQLQVALKWAGFYDSAIDGAFGRGTRGSMAGWQSQNGYEATGVLTTRQRAALLRQYNAILEGLDLQMVTDQTAGIQMVLPMGAVAFDRYEAPFAHYEPTGDIDARVVLISQEGDQKTLFGLYDILQTLEIIPTDGPRERRSDGFTIVGENARIVSHTEVTLQNGRIKGWVLVWPSGDEERRTRLLGEMQKSFERVVGQVMPSAMGADDAQSIDLLSGLEIRKPVMSRSGFYVSDTGHALTTLEAVAQCGRITLDNKVDAEVLAQDETTGIALLKPVDRVAPLGVARFATTAPRLQGEVAAAGYPYEGRLSAPTLNFGRVEELQGLSGETWVERLSISSLSGDAGGPVIDQSGSVIGMLRPASADGRQLPPGVSFAVDSSVLVDLLGKAGLSALAGNPDASLAPEDVNRVGMNVTALVSCWE
jgi:hypothetical protein